MSLSYQLKMPDFWGCRWFLHGLIGREPDLVSCPHYPRQHSSFPSPEAVVCRGKSIPTTRRWLSSSNVKRTYSLPRPRTHRLGCLQIFVLTPFFQTKDPVLQLSDPLAQG